LPQVEVPYDQLQDPEAIANWPQTLSRDGARTPMPWSSTATNAGFSGARPWLPVGKTHLGLTVDAQDSDGGSMLNFTRQCLDLRNRHPALHHGSMAIVRLTDQLIVFERESAGQKLRCSFNLSDSPAELPSMQAAELVTVGEVADGRLGPWSAIIEKLA
jgi:alpha-glucosidase